MHYILLLLCSLLMANECLNPQNHIDIRMNRNLRESAEIARTIYGTPMQYSYQKLQCIAHYPKTAKKTNAIAAPYTRWASDQRVKASQEYYKKNHEFIENLKLQVPSSVLISIIGVETNLGRFLGKYHTLTALANIVAESDPEYQHRLHDYMKGELAALLHIGYTNQMNIAVLKGSWDGGIGIAQFMPSSYLDYAKGQKQPANLFDIQDALISIDNYLVKKGGWQTGPIATQVFLNEEQTQHFNSISSREPIIEGSNLMLHRAKCDASLCTSTTDHQPLFIYKTQLKQEDVYWQTYQNFEAIRSYNPRIEYAIGVAILSQSIEELQNET